MGPTLLFLATPATSFNQSYVRDTGMNDGMLFSFVFGDFLKRLLTLLTYLTYMLRYADSLS